MAEEYYDPEDSLVPHWPRLSSQELELPPDEDMDWKATNFEDYGDKTTGLFLSMDPSLRLDASYPDPLMKIEDEDQEMPQKRVRNAHRTVLPLIIRGNTVMATPDSGSEDNIASLDLISRWCLDFDQSPEHQKKFRVVNGRFVKALGRIILEVVFAKNQSVAALCAFYVFRHLVTPVIMGLPFLTGTDTFVKNKHCLEVQSRPVREPLQICSLSSPRCRLYCEVYSEVSLANADTGSEVDLMSLAYVKRRGIHMNAIEATSSAVQFADGSVAFLAGQVDIKIVIGRRGGPSHFMTFLVLEDLTCDILLGEDFLFESDAFETYSKAFTTSDTDEMCDANTIVLLNMAGGLLSRFLKARSKKNSRSGK